MKEKIMNFTQIHFPIQTAIGNPHWRIYRENYFFHLLAGDWSEMVSPESTNWLYDYGFEDSCVPDSNFSASASGFNWSVQNLNGSRNVRYVKFLIFCDSVKFGSFSWFMNLWCICYLGNNFFFPLYAVKFTTLRSFYVHLELIWAQRKFNLARFLLLFVCI